jgi:hypothetical protein
MDFLNLFRGQNLDCGLNLRHHSTPEWIPPTQRYRQKLKNPHPKDVD